MVYKTYKNLKTPSRRAPSRNGTIRYCTLFGPSTLFS